MRLALWTGDYVKEYYVESDALNSSWIPTIIHTYLPEEQGELFLMELTLVLLKALRHSA
jgi:hypothetical protein